MSSPPATTNTGGHMDPTPPSAIFQSYHAQLESLQKLPVPYGEIYHALSHSDSAPLQTLDTQYQKAASDITQWLEAAEMTVFGLEMDVEQDGNSSQRDVGNIEVIMNRFQPNIGMLLELRDKISQRLDKDEDKTIIDKALVDQSASQIQSSWTALKSLLDKVKDLLSETRTRGDLLTQMENVVADIEEISAEIDAIQAQKSSPTGQSLDSTASRLLQTPTSPPLVSSTSTLDTTTAAAAATNASGLGVSASSENLLTTNKDRNTDLLAHADSCIEALATRMEFLRVQIDISSSNISSSDPIREQYDHIQHMWSEMKARRDKVSDEIKEARWLAVFDQVAGQVESMMESTERAVIHCKGLVDQIKTMVRDKVIPDAPIDRDHLYTIFKSFEAKHKYYAPAVNKMLNMLQSGIESRMTKNTDVIGKHAAMKQRWEQQKQELDRVEQDLEGIERLLDILDASIPSQTPTPPPQLPEKPIFAMRRSQTQPGWNSSGPQSQFQPPSQNQQQRGRRPAEESSARSRRLQSPNPPPSTTNTRSRPWSPAPSVSSLPSLLSPNPSNNYRSLSKSPSRSPSRVPNSDKLRPWCPSTTKTSPSIPGIPYSPSAASTYTPRSMSASGQSRATSPSPSPAQSRPTSSLSRTRSISCTPSLNRTPSQLKPAFTPAGSLSKLSTGVARSSSPTPPPAAASSTSLRRAQLKLPPPVVIDPTRMRQNSAPGTPMPQYSRRSSSPFGRDSTSSSSTSSLAATTASSSSSSVRTPVFSPPAARTRQAISQSNQSATQSRLPPQHQQNDTLLTRTRRPSLGYTSSKSVRSVASSSLSSLSSSSLTSRDRDTIDSAYGSVSGHLFPLDGPISPTTSSSSASSVTSAHSSLSSSSSSFGRLRLSRFHQLQPQGYSPQLQNQQEDELPELMDDLSIQVQDMAPYVPARESELDEEFAKIINTHPIQMKVWRLGEGKYYFGGRMEETPGGSLTAVGGKMVLCRLMEYGRLGVASPLSGDLMSSPVDEEKRMLPPIGRPSGPRSRSSSVVSRRSSVSSNASDREVRSRTTSLTGASGRSRKVMVRVGGGWQDLDIFLLDHSSLADETVVLRGLRA
ncbi:hypothetical protein EMPS_05925 [Entomortierella parvispora]|uniref:GAR domain-containing protein n=1 Tax=Entomortierella parvispora TaxID=205924 RepID=A0A9P3LWZ2_9FUNG|nr:hypothetical protein EMPS_05925 [Entomortierella parvispora]